MTKKKSKHNFTIIESLIIITVIIIIIAGLVFVKKMLIENNVKSLVMQIKKYNTAVEAFTEKYHALPGDIQDTVTYNITAKNTDGNNDNIITDESQNIIQANGELTNFWMHLSKSKMLDENYDGEKNIHAKIGSTFPVSRIGDKVGIIAFGAEGKTFYQIGLKIINADKIFTSNRSLKTDEAFLFDKKIDDGNPQKGEVVVVGGEKLNVTQNNECVKFGDYDSDNSIPACQLRIEVK